jgi:hypothetical protein
MLYLIFRTESLVAESLVTYNTKALLASFSPDYPFGQTRCVWCCSPTRETHLVAPNTTVRVPVMHVLGLLQTQNLHNRTQGVSWAASISFLRKRSIKPRADKEMFFCKQNFCTAYNKN